MDKQMSLSAINDELAQVRTKKKEFLEEIERIIPWDEWLAIIQPYYYKGERGNKPYNLERMFRIYLIENLYNLSDMATVTPANEHEKSSIRAKVEHVFAVIKLQLRFKKTRYRGLKKPKLQLKEF